MKQHRILFPLLFVAAAAMTIGATAQTAIDSAGIESWVDLPVTSHAWDANDNISGSAMPDTTALTAIIAGGPADFRSIVRDLKRNMTSVLKRMPASVPGADSFPAATHVELISFAKPGSAEDSILYRFSILGSASLTHLGVAGALIDSDGNGTKDTIASRYTPSGWKDRELPATSGRTWTSSFTQQAWVRAPIVGPILVAGTSEEREYEIRGTTTLTTPDGTAPAIVLHIYEFIKQPQGGADIALERFSYISRDGTAVTVAYRLDGKESRRRVGINDIAWFVPAKGSSALPAGNNHPRGTMRLE